MPRLTLLTAALALAAPAAADEPGDDAKDVATKFTAAGAAMFDARDAKGLAATYVEDARFDLVIKGKDSDEVKVETYQGRADIEAYYRKLFEGDRRPRARNTVEYARRVGPDLMVIAGVFVPDTEADTPLKLAFTQVRAREGGAWRIVRLQVVLGPET